MNGRKCDVKRRDFLKVAAAAAACPYLVSASALGLDGRPSASERIAIGAIGVGKRARMLLEQTPEAGQIVALCDCNLPRAEAFKKEKKANWAIYQDYRKVLDRKDIEAVIIATGEFQRVLPCIHACQAGKDIYAEKPLTLYIHEGRILVEAVGKHQRILQVGTQQRSMAMDCIASELVRSGGLGKVKEVLAVNYPGPDPSPAKPFPAQPVPAGLDWDIWLNQGAARSYNGEWMNWEHWRDFAGGQVTNWGAHAVDQIQAALGTDATGPVEMWLNEHKMVEMRYANGVPLRFVLDHGPAWGAVFVCEKGKLEINRNKFSSNPKSIAADLLKKVNEAEEEKKWAETDQATLWQAKWHIQNWLDCIRTRKKPAADVETGHRAVTISHLVNLTLRLQRRLKWDPVQEQFLGDDEANKMAVRPRRKGYELPNPV